MSKLLSTCARIEVSEADLDRAGTASGPSCGAIDARDFGRSRAVDESTLDAFVIPGKSDGVVLDQTKFGRLLDSYYELSGWNPANGWPSRPKLDELGMTDMADGLEAVGRLG